MQDNGHACLCNLPGRFRASKAAANDMDGRKRAILGHGALFITPAVRFQSAKTTYLLWAVRDENAKA
jgi:hypothetical protein